MRSFIYIMIVMSLFFVPLDRVRISQLEPVKWIAIREEEGSIIITTDKDNVGRGESIREAIASMKANSTRIVYLETVQYLFVPENNVGYVEDIREYLKGSVRVCITDRQEDLEAMFCYHDTHSDLPRLRDWTSKNNLKKGEKSS